MREVARQPVGTETPEHVVLSTQEDGVTQTHVARAPRDLLLGVLRQLQLVLVLNVSARKPAYRVNNMKTVLVLNVPQGNQLTGSTT